MLVGKNGIVLLEFCKLFEGDLVQLILMFSHHYNSDEKT